MLRTLPRRAALTALVLLAGSGTSAAQTASPARVLVMPFAVSMDTPSSATQGASLVREIITIERQCLHRLLREGKITDETRRRIERDLDLEEAVVDNREKNGPL